MVSPSERFETAVRYWRTYLIDGIIDLAIYQLTQTDVATVAPDS